MREAVFVPRFDFGFAWILEAVAIRVALDAFPFVLKTPQLLLQVSENSACALQFPSPGRKSHHATREPSQLRLLRVHTFLLFLLGLFGLFGIGTGLAA